MIRSDAMYFLYVFFCTFCNFSFLDFIYRVLTFETNGFNFNDMFIFSDIPTLVQVQEPWQKMYLGISIGKGICTHFDMVHLKKVPLHCKYLTGTNVIIFEITV